MQRLGQSSKLFLKKDIEWMGHFVMSQKTVLSKESSPCEDDPGYSYLNCIMSSISKMAGCHLDWFSPLLEENTKSCENVEEILRCRDFKQVLKIQKYYPIQLCFCFEESKKGQVDRTGKVDWL